MRRCYRRTPPFAIAIELARRQRKVDLGAAKVAVEWPNFRATKSGRAWAKTLADCSGARGRCMYCSDSRAVDVEHYRPKELFPEVAFQPRNHLLVCTPCNRAKGSRFPMATGGEPLLINPFEQDPWSCLFLDVRTGVIVPRYMTSGGRDRQGEVTLSVLSPYNSSAAEIGRASSARRLLATAAAVVRQEASTDSVEALLRAVDEDDYDIASWFLLWDGRLNIAFVQLASQEALAQRRFAKRVVRKRQGLQ